MVIWTSAIPHKIRYITYQVLSKRLPGSNNPNKGVILQKTRLLMDKIEFYFNIPFGTVLNEQL